MAYTSHPCHSLYYTPADDTHHQQSDRPATVPPPNTTYAEYSTFTGYNQTSGHTAANQTLTQGHHTSSPRGDTTGNPASAQRYLVSTPGHITGHYTSAEVSRASNPDHRGTNDHQLFRPKPSRPDQGGQSSRLISQAASTQFSNSILYASSPSRPHPCDLCPLSFDRAYDLKRHRETHTNLKPYQCPGCGKTFTRKDAVKRHQTDKRCGLGLEVRQVI